MKTFKKVFEILNGIETAADLKKIGFALIDFEYSKATFYMLQKSYNENRGKRADAKTLLKPVADFYKKNGFKVTENNGIFYISYAA